MCTLAYFHRMFPDAPALLMANRDELNDRPWEGPTIISNDPVVFGPRDTQAGGTWLGLNEFGLLVTITNHYGTLSNGSSMCSRGTVVLEALRQTSAARARGVVEELCPCCKAFTLLIADNRDAFVVDHPGNGTVPAFFELAPGPHVVTNARFREEGDVKAARVRRFMEEFSAQGEPGFAQARLLMGDHLKEEGQLSPLCTHAKGDSKFATVSSSFVKLAPGGGANFFAFAPGPPCVTDYEVQLLPFSHSL